MQTHRINSSRIAWDVMSGDQFDDFETSYCADGDGMLQVVVYPDRIEIQDQMEPIATFPRGDVAPILEAAQQYLAATYPEIYAAARQP